MLSFLQPPRTVAINTTTETNKKENLIFLTTNK
ncbi:MAG: hypothetical protein ACJAZ2_002262 [Glaciecola sp.]